MRALQLASFLILCVSSLALKDQDWKSCSDAAFCRRGRALAARATEAGSTWKSPYSVDSSTVSIKTDEAAFSASVKSSIYPDIKFKLDLQVLKDGVVRVRMDEVDGLRKRYNEAANWALISEPEVSNSVKWTASKQDTSVTYGDLSVVVQHQPLKVSLLRNGKEEIVLNGGGLLHMEHFRTKHPEIAPPEGEEENAQEVLEVENPAAWFEGEEDGWWEESWKTWKDSKPKGTDRFCHSSTCVHVSTQVLNHYLSILTFLNMAIFTVFLSTQHCLTSLRPKARELNIMNPIV